MFGKDRDKMVHVVERESTLGKFLHACLEAYEKRTKAWSESDNSQVLTAINNLSRKVDEFMSTQEERLKGVQTALTGIAEGVNTLQQQVADLKANNPELEDEISAIEGTVKGIADDINGVVPGGGETGGETGGGTEG